MLTRGFGQLLVDNIDTSLPADLRFHLIDRPGLQHLIVNFIQRYQIHLCFVSLINAIYTSDALQNDIDAAENGHEKNDPTCLL